MKKLGANSWELLATFAEKFFQAKIHCQYTKQTFIKHISPVETWPTVYINLAVILAMHQ